VSARHLDLDVVEAEDQWIVGEPVGDEQTARARRWLAEGTGTIVLWRHLDRVLPDRRPEGGWARRRLESLAARTAEHLGIVFHRFLEGSVIGRCQLAITVNGQKVQPWNPFAPDERARVELPGQQFELVSERWAGKVSVRRFVLPSRDSFSSQGEFDRLSGPLKWNRQQGLYFYRENRLVQWGGWAGIRAIDEHTKLARAALEFGSELDEAFTINVAKMRVSLPPELRQMIEHSVNELCVLADDAYRKTSRIKDQMGSDVTSPPTNKPRSRNGASAAAGQAIQAAALQCGEWDGWERITAVLREQAPEVLTFLGLDS
jgi:hypothetical protein